MSEQTLSAKMSERVVGGLVQMRPPALPAGSSDVLGVSRWFHQVK